MKTNRTKQLKILIVVIISTVFFTDIAFCQSAGFNSSFAVINAGGSDVYYCMPINTPCGSPNPNLNAANLGSFKTGNTLVLRGAEINNYKCGSANISSTRLNYRLYINTPGSFIAENIGFDSDVNNGCGGKDQRWKNIVKNIDLLAGLTVDGTYTLEVYLDQSTNLPAPNNIQYLSNGGSNYKATFSFCLDQDLDNVCNATDNCPTISNNNQSDLDGDNIGDACDVTYTYTSAGWQGGFTPSFTNPDEIITVQSGASFEYEGTIAGQLINYGTILPQNLFSNLNNQKQSGN